MMDQNGGLDLRNVRGGGSRIVKGRRGGQIRPSRTASVLAMPPP
jgi:hypothetical protein